MHSFPAEFGFWDLPFEGAHVTQNSLSEQAKQSIIEQVTQVFFTSEGYWAIPDGELEHLLH